jgi:hypothetical protein
MNKIAVLIAALALAGCGKKEIEQLKGDLGRTQGQLQQAQDALAKVQREKDAQGAEMGDLKQLLRSAKDAAKMAETQAQYDKESLTEELGKLKKDLQAANDAAKAAQASAEAAKGAAPKAADPAAAAAADKARADAEALAKQVEDLKRKEKDLQDRLAAKVTEAEQARTASAALEKQAQDAQAKADLASAAQRERLCFTGKEALSPNLAMPLTFNARKGETFKWGWTVAEAPPELAVEALDFMIVGPDGAKAHGVRAGVEKKGDEGSLAATADGRWTAVWQNRHPSAPFTINYTVSLEPSGAPAIPTGGG